MLLSGCNVADVGTHFRYIGRKQLPYRWNFGVFIRSCSARPTQELAVDGLRGSSRAVGPEMRSGRVYLGSVAEDGKSFKENFVIRSYNVGINTTATIQTMAHLMQEIGCNHFQSVGYSTNEFGTSDKMRELHLIWVISRMHIEVYKYPAWGDVVEIETWTQDEGSVSRRDWIFRDFTSGTVTGRATSKWVMMNQDTRRYHRISDDLRGEYLMYCPKVPRLISPSLILSFFFT